MQDSVDFAWVYAIESQKTRGTDTLLWKPQMFTREPSSSGGALEIHISTTSCAPHKSGLYIRVALSGIYTKIFAAVKSVLTNDRHNRAKHSLAYVWEFWGFFYIILLLLMFVQGRSKRSRKILRRWATSPQAWAALLCRFTSSRCWSPSSTHSPLFGTLLWTSSHWLSARASYTLYRCVHSISKPTKSQ